MDEAQSPEERNEAAESSGAAEAQTPADSAAEEENGADLFENFPLPPATFEVLVLSLRSQAEMHLGLFHFGEEKDRPKPNLPLARHAIDMLAMLLEKTKGNLSLEEQRMLENAVTELRFRVVQASQGG